MRASAARSPASACPTASSNAARSRRCRPATASPPRPSSPACLGATADEDHRHRDLHRRRRLEELALRPRRHRRRHPRHRRGHAQRLHRHHRGRRPRAQAPRDRRGPAPHHRARQAHARQRLARRRPHPPHRHRRGRGRLLGHPRQVARRADPPAPRRPGARQRARLRQRLVPHRAHARGLPRRRPRRDRQGLQRVQGRPLRHRPGLHLARGARALLRDLPARSATACRPTPAS